MILATVPAILILIIGQFFYSKVSPGDRRWFWIRIWLAAAVLLALPFAIFSTWIFTGPPAIFLLLLPVLIGILALLLVHWRSVRDLYQADRWPIGALLLILAAQILLAVLLEPQLALLLLLPPLAIAGLWVVFGRIQVGWLAALGWLLVFFLPLDAAGLVGGPLVYSQAQWRTAYKIISSLAALLAPSWLLGWCGRAEARDKGEKHVAWTYFALVGLLALAIAAVTLRYAVLTKATSPPQKTIYPSAPGSRGHWRGAALVCTLQPGTPPPAPGYCLPRARSGGRHPVIFLGVAHHPLAITRSRAQRLAALIEKYKKDNGQYPPGLNRSPRTTPPGYLVPSLAAARCGATNLVQISTAWDMRSSSAITIGGMSHHFMSRIMQSKYLPRQASLRPPNGCAMQSWINSRSTAAYRTTPLL